MTSTIDHICVSSVLGQFILDYDVMNDVDNFSDHNPVICQLDIPLDYIEPSKFAKCHKTSWNKANDDHFQDYARLLDVLLSKLNTNVPGLLCSDINCKSSDHVNQLNELYNSIIDCLCLAESESLPQIKTKEVFHNAGIPGWHEKVAPFRERSIFWRDIWRDNGSPRNGTVADIMHSAKARYHYEVKQCKKQANTYLNERLASSLSSNNVTSFWQKVKNIKRAEKFKDLYNCASYSSEGMCKLMETIDDKLNKCVNCCNHHVSNITVVDVLQGVDKLKYGKSDAIEDILTDNIIYGSHRLYVIGNFIHQYD